MLAATFRRAVEWAVTEALALDEETAGRLAEIPSTYIGLETGTRELDAVVRIAQGSVEISPPDAVMPDVVLSGRPLGILRVLGESLRRGDLSAAAAGESVSIRGDRERLANIVRVAHGLRPDIEERLSHLVGDVAARHVGTAARSVAGWSSEAATRVERAAREYVEYESDTVPARIEWNDHVERLAALDARLQGLRARIEALQGETGESDDVGEDPCPR